MKDVYIGGDIIEYYGMSESMINHQSLELRESDKQNLIQRFGPGYFHNPEYYFKAPNGQRYSGHFWSYSLTLIPARLALRALGIDEVKAISVTNVLILSVLSFVIFLLHLKSFIRRIIYLVVVYISPVVSFLVWPGPEIYVFALVFWSVVLFTEKKYGSAVIIAAIASWQSQPLLVFVAVYGLYMLWEQLRTLDLKDSKQIGLIVAKYSSLILCIFLPNVYAFFTFHKLHGLSNLDGVGIQNFTVLRLVEIFFDPNFGLYFYLPVIGIIGIYVLLRQSIRESRYIIYFLALIGSGVLFTAITNWNHGTAGYGPMRYALYLMPVMMYFFVTKYQNKLAWHALLTVSISLQIILLSMNGFLMPRLENSFVLTPMAKFVLIHMPKLYNPTSEIFIERTIGHEEKYVNVSIFRNNGKCIKAYVTTGNADFLKSACGSFDSSYTSRLADQFRKPSDAFRDLVTTEATFYPKDGTCAYEVNPSPENPYVCIRNIHDVARLVGIDDQGRFEQLSGPGSWHMKWGKPTRIKLPPGYIIDHYSLDGIYVNF